MKVSVVIPLYNKAPYIRRTLDSVLGQTFGKFELIVVDDGSTDASREVVDGMRDRRVRLISQANAGPAAARNLGLSKASGQYIVFMDADDEWKDGFLNHTVELLEQSPDDVAAVCTGYLTYPQARSTWPMWQRRGLNDGVLRLTPDSPAIFAVHLLAFMSPWNTLARTEVVRRFGGFCRRGKFLYAEDAFLWLQVLMNHAIRVSPAELVCYHTEASGLAMHRRQARPIEPMLIYPQDLRATCPEPMIGLLDNILAIRAAKTALMLGYFGQWRAGRALLSQFCPMASLGLPNVALAQLAATPAGAAAGWLVRHWVSKRGPRPTDCVPNMPGPSQPSLKSSVRYA